MKRIFKFIGIKKIAIYEIGSVDKLNDQKIKHHLDKILKKGTWLIDAHN